HRGRRPRPAHITDSPHRGHVPTRRSEAMQAPYRETAHPKHICNAYCVWLFGPEVQPEVWQFRGVETKAERSTAQEAPTVRQEHTVDGTSGNVSNAWSCSTNPTENRQQPRPLRARAGRSRRHW